jgi:hypothetical protein
MPQKRKFISLTFFKNKMSTRIDIMLTFAS